MELHLMYDAAHGLLGRHGFNVARSLVGNYVTPLDMAGCSITLAMLDERSPATGTRRCTRRRSAGACSESPYAALAGAVSAESAASRVPDTMISSTSCSSVFLT